MIQIFLATLSACLTPPTTSGRPQVLVTLSPGQASERLSSSLTAAGYTIIAISDTVVSATRVFAEGRSLFDGPSSYAVRFDLKPVDKGTWVLGSVTIHGATVAGATSQDLSEGKTGRECHRFLEAVFHDELLYGPLLR